jgi:hypothetical protein
VLSNGEQGPHHHTLGAAREVPHPAAAELGCSLGLEDEEGLVAAFEEVEEASPFCVVGNREGKVLAADDVPAGAAVLGEWVLAEAVLDLGGDELVERVLLIALLTDTDNVLDNLKRHVSESGSVLGHGQLIFLMIAFFV